MTSLTATSITLTGLAADADIIGDLRRIVTEGRKHGYRYNRAMCSQKTMDMLVQNTAIQKAVNGVNMLGVMITEEGINQLFNRLFGFTISTNDDYYEYGDDKTARLFDEDKFILYVGDNNGAVGTGLWGVTPEEIAEGGFENRGSYDGYIYITQWFDHDPVAQWTKASGVFIPVLPNPKGHVIITIADGARTLKDLDVNTAASETTSNGTKVDIYPGTPASGNSYVYTVSSKYQKLEPGATVTGWTAITNGSEITVPGKEKCITVAEINSSNKAVGIGHATIYKKTGGSILDE